MIAPSSRLLVLAAAAVAVTTTSATDATTFPAAYDVLAVSLEFEVELLATQAAAAKNDKLGASFNAFADTFDRDVAAGNLTAAQHNAALDAFFTEADVTVPSFTTTTKAALLESWDKYAFEFLLDLHASQWDALQYGITEAKPSPEITALLEKLDTYMVENVKTAGQDKLQEQVDTFFTDADKLTPGFKKSVVDILKEKGSASLPIAKEDAKATTTTAPPVTTPPTTAPTKAPAGSAATRTTLAVAAATFVAAAAMLLL